MRKHRTGRVARARDDVAHDGATLERDAKPTRKWRIPILNDFLRKTSDRLKRHDPVVITNLISFLHP